MTENRLARTREVVFVNFYRREVGRYVNPEGEGREVVTLAPSVWAMAVVSALVFLPTLFAAAVIGTPWYLALPVATLGGQVASAILARGWARDEVEDRLTALARAHADLARKQRGALSAEEAERLKLMHTAVEAELPWLDYAGGEIWPFGDERLAAAIEELEGKRKPPRSEPSRYRPPAVLTSTDPGNPTAVTPSSPEIETMLDNAVAAGKISVTRFPYWRKVASTDLELTRTLLAKMPGVVLPSERRQPPASTPPERRPVAAIETDLAQLGRDWDGGRIGPSAYRSLHAELIDELSRAQVTEQLAARIRAMLGTRSAPEGNP